jgi:hypothetical protein
MCEVQGEELQECELGIGFVELRRRDGSSPTVAFLGPAFHSGIPGETERKSKEISHTCILDGVGEFRLSGIIAVLVPDEIRRTNRQRLS